MADTGDDLYRQTVPTTPVASVRVDHWVCADGCQALSVPGMAHLPACRPIYGKVATGAPAVPESPADGRTAPDSGTFLPVGRYTNQETPFYDEIRRLNAAVERQLSAEILNKAGRYAPPEILDRRLTVPRLPEIPGKDVTSIGYVQADEVVIDRTRDGNWSFDQEWPVIPMSLTVEHGPVSPETQRLLFGVDTEAQRRSVEWLEALHQALGDAIIRLKATLPTDAP